MGQWAAVEDLKWYYNPNDGGGIHGPVTRIQLAEWLDGEEISQQTMVREGTAGDWQPVLNALGRAPVVTAKGDVGRVTSAAWSPRLGGPVALAYVHRDVAAPGTAVVVRAGDAEVAAIVQTPQIK